MSNNSPNLRFIYDRRHKATDVKTASVEIEVYFNRKQRKFISTGIQVLRTQWAEDHVANHVDSESLNQGLNSLCNKINRIITAMQVDKEEINLLTFTDRYEGKSKPASFIDFMYDSIQRRQLRDSTRRAHLSAWETLKRFGKIQSFSDLTSCNIERFDAFLRKEDPARSQVTLHGYHKRIKPYVIEAYKLRYVDINPYNIFDDVRGSSKEREPLSLEELNRLRGAALPERLDKVRDLFVFCCYTGLSFSDMCLFDYSKDVVESKGLYYIDGERLKTGTKFYTPVLAPALEVLDKHCYRLPTISLQKYNDYLHLIELKLELRKPLTSHIARHTFATTVTLANEVPIETVSRMLGHKHISTTQIYAKVLNASIEKQAEKLSHLI